MGDLELPDGLRDELRGAWHRYIDLLAPLRPALHGYCRRLSGNLWDIEVGREQFTRPQGWFHHFVHGHPEWPVELAYESPRLERAAFDGEPVALGFCTRRGREAMEQVLRLVEEDGRIARIRGYSFCPEVIREVGAALGFRVRTGLYRYPTPAPGKSW